MKRILQLSVAFLAALVAQSVCAATPVATWTDFSSLNGTAGGTITSAEGNHTLTVRAGCSVAEDGALVIGSSGNSAGADINYSGSTKFTLQLDVSGCPDGKILCRALFGGNALCLQPSGTALYQRWTANMANDWHHAEWTASDRQTITVAYDGTDGSSVIGTQTYRNGEPFIAYNSGLKATGTNVSSLGIGYQYGTEKVATGMKVYAIRVFNTRLTDDEVKEAYVSILPDFVVDGFGYDSIGAAMTAASEKATSSEKTVVVAINKAVSDNITIPANVSVVTSKDAQLSGTVSGSGEIVFDAGSTNTLPGWTLASEWNGLVTIKDWGTIGPWAKNGVTYQICQTDLGANNGLFSKVGSKVKFIGVAGYTTVATLNKEIILETGTTSGREFGWKNDSGGSSSTTVIDKLSGDGLFFDLLPLNTQTFIFKDASNFSGSFDVKGKQITLGAETKQTTEGGQVYIGSSVAFALTGSGKYLMPGFPTNQTVLNSLSNSAWTGTLTIASVEKTGQINLAPYGNSGSTLELKGLTGATRHMPNGCNIPFTLKVSGDITFNQGSSSTSYTIAKVTGAGNLSLLNWSGSSSNDANHGYTITKLEGYTGTLTTTRFTTIGELALASEPNAGDKLVTLGSGSQNTIKVNSVTVGGQPLSGLKKIEIAADGIYCRASEVTSEETMDVFGYKNVGDIVIGNGGVQKFAGTAGIRTTELTIKNGGKLVNDPIKNPIYVTGGAPTLQDGAKIALAEKYAAYTKGVFTLMTWDGDTTATTVIPDDLFEATTAQQTNGPKLSLETYTTHVDNSKGIAKTYTALKLDLDPNGVKPKLKIMPLGDSITEGSNPDGLANPNYRVILMAKMASLGYDVSSTGMRMIKNWNAAGIYQPMEWSWHSGVSGQTLVSTGSRAGWRDSLEAMLDASEIPDIITFKIGTNDSLASRDINQSVAEWVEVMRRIIKARPSTKIIVGSIMPFQNGGTWGSGENSWNAKLKKAIDENTYNFPEGQVFYAPLAENCLRTMDGKSNFVDSLHPNWTGHERNAETWATTITAALTAYPSAPGTYTPNEEVGAAANVSKDYITRFTKLAAFSPDNTVIAKDGEPNYSFKAIGLDSKSITKVAYYMELKNERSGNVRWVWADMDNWNEDKSFSKIAIPTAYTYCGSAQNLHVDSNDAGIEKIAPSVSGKTAWLQFTRGDLIKDTGAEGAPAAYSPRDWNDACDDSGNYGVMNLYRVAPTAVANGVNALPAQVLMAYSRWTQNDQQIGIGNFMVHGQPLVYGNIGDMPVNYYDTYQFERLDLASYTVANIEIWGKIEGEEGPTSWETVTDDDVTTVVELPEGVTTTTVTAEELAAWAGKFNVPFESGAQIPVNALILNCAPDAIDTAEAEVLVDEATLGVILGEVAKLSEGQTLDLSKIEIPNEIKAKYPMAKIEVIRATELPSTETAKFFKLQLSLK